MSAKRAVCTTAVCGHKKKRKSVSLKVKFVVLKRITEGQRAVDIARALGLKPTTVRAIRGNAEKIKLCAQRVTPLAATKLTLNRRGIMENIERLLNIWMEGQHHQRDSPCLLLSIQAKAISLFENLKQQDGDGAEIETFVASRGWFECFKKHSNLHNIHVTGESADKEAAAAYPAVLKKIIEDGGYTPQQVFNVDKTGLFWK